VHQYHPCRRGGAIKVPEVTDTGWNELHRFDMKRPIQVLGGGWEHNLCGLVVGELGRQKKYRPSYEVPVGLHKKLRVDVVLENLLAERVYCQCCFSSAEREAANAVEALSGPPVTFGQLLLICRDKAFANKLSKLLKGSLCRQQHLRIKVFGDLLESYYKKVGDGLLWNDHA
jgi:hypothetical protein